ncbi:hypothetical protein BTUL_0002g00630 [Botrytis tulipae]|uniref:Uncharacterized protein n=1 Tax=Botrytis tulipae TaxID=87230 RepID=A0A4Z1F8F4_9HELO|nr:hypothetical protein BTUL_0002g00630 [Botrytis tulipae]
MSSDSSRKSSMSHWSSIERRRQRQLFFQEVRTPYMTASISSPANLSGPATQVQANRVRTQAHSTPSMDFGPYEDSTVKDRRKLPFEVQWSISFRMFRTLENAIFDFTKKWAPTALAMNDFISGKKVELNFWERFLATPIVNPIAFENQGSIPRFHQLLDRLKEVRHTFVHRKEPPVLYLEHMLADGIELTTMIGDETRAHKLDQIYQMVHYMASLLRDQISNETKTILEDRLQAGRRAQDMSIDWLESNRLKKQEIEIKRDLTHDTAGFEALYANTLQALEDMMQPLTDTLTDD